MPHFVPIPFEVKLLDRHFNGSQYVFKKRTIQYVTEVTKVKRIVNENQVVVNCVGRFAFETTQVISECF